MLYLKLLRDINQKGGIEPLKSNQETIAIFLEGNCPRTVSAYYVSVFNL